MSCHQLNCKFMRCFLSTHRCYVVASRAENTEQRRCFSWSTSLGGFCCCKASSSASPKAFEALGSSLNVQPQKWLSLQRPFSGNHHTWKNWENSENTSVNLIKIQQNTGNLKKLRKCKIHLDCTLGKVYSEGLRCKIQKKIHYWEGDIYYWE